MIKKNILIVEDDPVTASDLKNALHKFGFEIDGIVKSAKSTMQSIKVNEPDIILLDINLGSGGNGIEIAHNIRKIQKIPILFLTSFSDEETFEEACLADPIGYLIKPFKREELKATIMLALYKINKFELKNINQKHIYIGYGYYFDYKNKKLYYQNKYIKLGLKERQLLTILIELNGNIITAQDLEHKLWLNNVPSSSSLRTLIYRVKIKLGCKIIATTNANGYTLQVMV